MTLNIINDDYVSVVKKIKTKKAPEINGIPPYLKRLSQGYKIATASSNHILKFSTFPEP